jgi:hypothetical protein
MKMRFVSQFFLSVVLLGVGLSASQINDRGYWEGADSCVHHFFDVGLAPALVEFFKHNESQSIVDFGCGMADYVKHFRASGLNCDGYDGNPNTPELTQGIAGVKDLSKPFDLAKKYDWVMSLEVGEHLPKKYEKMFIENLVRHCRHGIVLSWALKGQGGHGHFNEQDNEYVKQVMEGYGFYNDPDSENVLRSKSHAGWFKNTVMVFRKK